MLETAILILIATISAIVIAVVRIRANRTYIPACPVCGYSLVELESDTCPECGNPAGDGRRAVCGGPGRAIIRSLAVIILAFLASLALVLLDDGAPGVHDAEQRWLLHSNYRVPGAPAISVVGTGQELVRPSELAAARMPALQQLSFQWEGKSVIVFHAEGDDWVDASGQPIVATDILDRLGCDEVPAEQINALMTLDWANGELDAHIEAGTKPFAHSPHAIQFRGSQIGWQNAPPKWSKFIVVVWLAALGVIVLAFWVDRRSILYKFGMGHPA